MKKLLLSILIFAHPALSSDDTLVQCRQIEAIEERVACYDNVVDSRHHAASENSVSASPAPEAIEVVEDAEVTETSAVVEPPDALSLFGTSDAEAKRIVATTMSIEQLDRIEAQVADVHKSATRKLTVTLDIGHVWRQLDNQPLRIKVGDTVTIRKASFGSFLMRKKSGGRSIRVKRVN